MWTRASTVSRRQEAAPEAINRLASFIRPTTVICLGTSVIAALGLALASATPHR